MERSFFRHAVDVVADAVLLLDPEGVIRYANQSAATVLEQRPEDLEGTGVHSWAQKENRDSLDDAIRRAAAGTPQHLLPDPLFGGRHDGAGLHILSPGTGNYILAVRHLSEPEHESNVREDQDPVTGLLNRRTLPRLVERELERSRRNHANPVALLFVMLRDFKQINQMHGHQVGDLLLENSGIRIRETVRKSDSVFRWEGTNLVVLLPDLATRLDGLLVAEKIHSAVTVPYRFRGLDLAPGCHIGIAVFPEDGKNADELFNAANSAVVEAERRSEAFRYFDQETHQMASDRMTLKTGLQRAFERNELELYFQPIVRPDGVIAGAEALMRWNHPTRGVLGPGSFIDIAEDSRLIAPIDKLALYTACRHLAAMEARPDFFLTLNVSAINLSDTSLPAVVEQAIRDTGLRSPSRLKLELTESHTVKDRPQFTAVAEEIQAMGVEIWIDDFGTGQSSLSYLKHLPISTVKIDKDFVADLGNDQSDIDYLRGIVETVRSRDKRIVVEGISTEAQRTLVRGLPVDFLQGFLFSAAVPFDEFLAMVEDERSLPATDP